MKDNFDDESSPEGIIADPTILRVDGTPREGEDITNRRGMLFNAVAKLVGKVVQGAELGEEFVRAKVAQETNTAAKIAADAAELASRRELNEANANVARQSALEKYINNLERMKNLPPAQQAMALAKLMEQEPELVAQLERIEHVANKLRNINGAIIGLLNDGNPTGE